MRTGFRPLPMLIAIGISLVIWFVVPMPAGVSRNAWELLALFVGTMAAIIGKAMPIGAMSILAITLVAISGVTDASPAIAIKDALSTLSSPLIWLIGVSIMISRSIIKTGLGARIGYYFISLWGRKTLGISYSLALAELLLAPITPSNTARGGAIIHPVMRSIATSFGSSAEDGTQNRIGRYLALSNYHTNPITSAMFITATAPNPLVASLIAEGSGGQIELSWGSWALAMLLPGLVAIMVMPLVLYLIYPPEIKQTPDAAQFARKQLQAMGPLSRQEWIMLGVFLLMLLLWANVPSWMFGPELKVDPTTTAFLGLSLLLLTGVLSWDDVIKEKTAWDTIVWFGALIMMATWLNKLGLIGWFAENIQDSIRHLGLGWQGASALLLMVYLYAHYFFASTTAHITAMFAAFYGAGLALGAPAMPFALMMATASSLMMTLTHYATGTSPIIFGSGYVTLGEWWKAGFVMSVVLLLVWLVVGIGWWKVLGHL